MVNQSSFVKNLVKLSSLMVLALVLISCSTTKTSLKQDVDNTLKLDEGYLLIGINTTQDLEYINIDGETNLRFTKEDLRQGSSYILTTAPTGKYYLKTIGTGNRYRVRLKQESWSFEVKPGQISYIGDLDFTRNSYFYWIVYAVMDNRSSFAIKFLQENFPNILNNRQLHYAGPGEDRFLHYYYQFLKQQNQSQQPDTKEVKS